MSSTCDSEALVSIANVDVTYNLDIHSPATARDAFVKAASSPFSLWSGQKFQLNVLQDLNLKIYKGDRLGLLGTNGTGKSSLCRIISGGYRPQAGTVTTRGKILAIFDTTIGIIPELTGRENAALLYEFLFPELPPAEKVELLEEALEFSELGKFVDAPFQSYSKGMQARLCLSVISARGSDILILDEVFDGADQFFKDKISDRVVRMIESSGVVIFVSHVASQIQQVCNRVVVLKDGRVAYDGDVDNGVEEYARLNS